MKKIIYLAFFLLSLNGFSQINLTANLKVCMPFSGNANDMSGSGNHGTVAGATLTADRFGNPNSAYAFWTNMSIKISSLAAVAPTDELTISMWARALNNTSNCLFQLDPDVWANRCVGCAAYSNSGGTMMLFDYGDLFSGGRTVTTGFSIDLNNWHHYVYVLSQTGNLKQMYRDGTIISNAPYALTCTVKNSPFSIGGGFDQGSGSLWFNGNIDDICIYNRALNSMEISALYAGTNACFSVGVKELESIEKALVYPTVSETGIYNFSMNGMNSESLIEIYSTDGKLIKSFSGLDKLNNTIDISTAQSGIYIVKMINGEKVFNQKLIKK